MGSTKTILVATDFAEPSRAAADIGLQLAQRLHVPLVLVHAFLVPGSIYMGVPMAVDYARAYEETAREWLDNERSRLAGGGAEVDAVLRSGVAWEEILATAE